MNLEELDKLALEYYEKGGDIIVECFEKHEKQAFLNMVLMLNKKH